MQSGKRLKVEVDRLSSLPDDLIYKILSYVNIVYCIRLSVLSSRWRFIWTSMPTLNFSSRKVEFVNNVLSIRNNKISEVTSISLNLAVDNPDMSVKRILEYAFSHNVQQLTICTLIYSTIDCRSYSPWDLPALTSLHLHHVRLYNFSSLLATCKNLKNLTLERCKVSEHEDSGRFAITNSRLLSLTIKKVKWYVEFVLVDTPQLKNFIFVDTHYDRRSISKLPGELTISALDLTYLRIKGSYLPKLSLNGLRSLEKVDLCISSPQKTDVHKIHDLFQRLHNVKSLALSLEIVELLSTSEEVISHQPSPFPSLKSLKIYPSRGLKTSDVEHLTRTYTLKSSLEMLLTQLDEEQEATKIKLSADVTNYLLDSSSNATYRMVSYEEARSIKITKAAYRLMAALWKILEKMEASNETDSCRKDFRMRIGPQGFDVVLLLQNTKILLTKVLASKRAEMQACFSRLCAKTKTVNQCDIEHHIFCGYVDEIALSP